MTKRIFNNISQQIESILAIDDISQLFSLVVTKIISSEKVDLVDNEKIIEVKKLFTIFS